MFEFLFNYSIDKWQDASLSFSHTWPWWLIAVALLLGALCIAFSLVRLPLSKSRRSVIALLQTGTLAVVLAMLLQPVLITEEVRRDDNVIGVVVDNSTSMSFPAVLDSFDNSSTRLEAALAALDEVSDELSETFEVRTFSIAEELLEVDSTQDLQTGGNRTDVVGGISELLERSSAGELAAVVVISDGGNNASLMDVNWWNRIRQANIPIHTVGVGPESIADDIELAEVSLPGTVSPSVSVTARVRIRHPIGTESVRLRVKNGSELRYAQDIPLQSGSNETLFELNFPSGDDGIQSLDFDVQSSFEESNRINNRVQRVVEVINQPHRILYIEGEPRWEYKFLRRAVEDNPDVDVVSLLRTSPNKFYRQGVINARELENGFPLTREALFGYDALMIGSLDAAELSTEQQANVRDFVAERGGALMMLGGTRGLADGGWGRSAVQAALPVTLGDGGSGAGDAVSEGIDSATFLRQRFSVELTELGRRAQWLKLPTPTDNPSFDGEGSADALNTPEASWASLPELANIQRVGELKAGTQVMLQSQPGGWPVLMWHRYGKGRSYVLATSGTWRWQMSLPSEDQRHEVFWENLLTELATRVPSRLSIDAGPSVQRDPDFATIKVVALGPDFTPHVGNELMASVTRPNGTSTDITLLPDINHPGHYLGTYEFESIGAHAINVAMDDPNDALEVNVHQSAASDSVWFMVEQGSAEYFAPELQASVLYRIADETNATYRTVSEISGLPAALLSRNNALTFQSELPLWNMPILFLLLLLGKALEWLLRIRWKRL